MSAILVCGLINVETNLQIEAFPIEYRPVRYPFFGVHSGVSGVGYNVAKALVTLGDDVSFLSLIGRDLLGDLVLATAALEGIPHERLLPLAEGTAQSVILYDRAGRRQINVDLKDLQRRAYPAAGFEEAISVCSLAALCNINFARPFLSRTRALGKLIATDVHAIADLEDAYNADFMAAAHILFMSDEHLPCGPEEWVRRVWDRYGVEIAVVGLGAEGALLGVRQDNFVERLPAVRIRPPVNTIGAGDALYSAFIHGYTRDRDPYAALRRALIFASYKIGASSAAEGFLGEADLETLYRANVV